MIDVIVFRKDQRPVPMIEEMNSNESQIVISNILNNKQIEQDLPF